MTTYRDAGVDIEAGSAASASAYKHAQATFAARKGKLGEPVTEEGGYAGMLDMGDFYLVQNDDGTGTKMDVAVATDTFNTLGYDLLASVADDAICVGAEVVSVSNTLDVPRVDKDVVDRLMEGLSAACSEQKIVIPGGEIAEVPGSVNTPVWNATAVGIVAKDRVLKPETIKEGDVVIALRSAVARSNGFSLIRKILTEQIGETWTKEKWEGDVTWGEVMLTPSVIYHGALLHVLGRYGEDRQAEIKGLAQITGGGIAENLSRTLKKSGCGAELTDLWEAHPALQEIVKLGNVPLEEAYRTWNMGTGMLAVVDEKDAEQIIVLLSEENIEAKVAGSITKAPGITLKAYDGSAVTT